MIGDGNDPTQKGSITLTYSDGRTRIIDNTCRFEYYVDDTLVLEYMCDNTKEDKFSEILTDCSLQYSPSFSCYGNNNIPLGYCYNKQY